MHPSTVQEQKDIDTFKRLLAELKAGCRGGVMEGVWIDEPAEYIELIERTIYKLSNEAEESWCSKSAQALGISELSRERTAQNRSGIAKSSDN
jgi:hypothetical protein